MHRIVPFLFALAPAALGAPSTERLSAGSLGEADGTANNPDVTPDGRWVAFESGASNLVTGDSNGVDDVFVRDTLTGTIVRVSVGPGGAQGDDDSRRPAISDDGRFVAFYSDASNLVPGDSSGSRDVFVRDRDPDADGIYDEPNATTTLVSVSSTGVQANGDSNRLDLSGDGRHVVFRAVATNLDPAAFAGERQIFAHDRLTGVTTLISRAADSSQGNAASDTPGVSENGRFVAFVSDAWNLVAGDTETFDPVACPSCTGVSDVFVRDRDPDADGIYDEPNAVTTRVSVSSAGVPGNGGCGRPTISNDGRHVTFRSDATNLVAADTNAAEDIFAHDRATGVTTRVSITTAGVQAEGSGPDSDRADLSANGRYLAFTSSASDLVPGDTNAFPDVFVKDLDTGAITRVSVGPAGAQGDAGSDRPSLSADGRFVAFYSDASTLVAGDDPLGFRDIFVRDRDPDADGIYDEPNAVTTRVSVSDGGDPGDADSTRARISADGRHVVFQSRATNLDPAATSGRRHVFVHDRLLALTRVLSVNASFEEGDADSDLPDVSGNGRLVVFESLATNLVSGDVNVVADVFVHDRDPDADGLFDEGNGVVTRVSVSSAEAGANAVSSLARISDDGSAVVFQSEATNLVSGDTNASEDVFVRNLATGTTVRVSLSGAGVQGNYGSGRADVSGDGRLVVFRTQADNLFAGDDPSFDETDCPECPGVRDAVVRDRDPDSDGIYDEPNAITTRVSAALAPTDRDVVDPVISADGSVIAYETASGALVPSDTNRSEDVFAYDRAAGTTVRASTSGAGAQASLPTLTPNSDQAFVSSTGRFLAFRSAAVNLAERDTNAVADVFLHDRDADADGTFDEPGAVLTERVSVSSTGVEGNGASEAPRPTADGSGIAFLSDSTDLVAADLNLLTDLFLRTRDLPSPCPADIDANGVLNLDDISAFIVAFIGADLAADLDGNGVLNLDDLSAFINSFLAGCP